MLTKAFLKAIRSTRYHPNRVHLLWFRRHRGHQRRDHPLRRENTVEPTESHRSMDEPPSRVLHVLLICSGYSGNEHVSPLPLVSTLDRGRRWWTACYFDDGFVDLQIR